MTNDELFGYTRITYSRGEIKPWLEQFSRGRKYWSTMEVVFESEPLEMTKLSFFLNEIQKFDKWWDDQERFLIESDIDRYLNERFKPDERMIPETFKFTPK